MAQYTLLHERSIQEILERYALGRFQSYKLLQGGSENTNYLVITENGKFVLTLCEQKSELESRKLAWLLQHLAQNNFTTSKVVLSKEEEHVILFNNKPILLKTYLDGDVYNILPSKLITPLGRDLATLHLIEAPNYLPKKLGFGKEHFHEVEQYEANSLFHSWLLEVMEYVNPYFQTNLPTALIHGDLFANNVVVRKDQKALAIMDFEEAAYYYRVFDIGMTLVGVCTEGVSLNTDKAARLLQGYQAVIKLTSQERKALKAFTGYAAAAMSFWRHKNFRFIHPSQELKDHYKELKKIADAIMKIPDKRFLQMVES